LGYNRGDILFYTVRAGSNSPNDRKNREKVLAILEVVALVFITTFIPSLIKLGRPPSSLNEIWVELLVALLASAYAYMRIRGIELKPE